MSWTQWPMSVIGWVYALTGVHGENLSAFIEGLEETGYTDGKNVAIEYRWADFTVNSAGCSLR